MESLTPGIRLKCPKCSQRAWRVYIQRNRYMERLDYVYCINDGFQASNTVSKGIWQNRGRGGNIQY